MLWKRNKKAIHPLNELGGLLATKRINTLSEIEKLQKQLKRYKRKIKKTYKEMK